MHKLSKNDMQKAKVDHFAGKTYLVKKTHKNSLFLVTKIGITSLWEGMEDNY